MGLFKRSAQKLIDVAWYAAHGKAKRMLPEKRSFNSAKVNNLTASWVTTPKPIDADIRAGLRKLKARARHEAQNNDYVRRFLGLVKTNVIGHQGITHQARVMDRDGKPDTLANDAIESGWLAWGKKGVCDVTGKLSWRMIQRLFIETIARDGEVLIREIKNWKGNKFRYALQFLDTELLDVDYNRDLKNGNTIRMSVELDQWRRPVAYHLLTIKQTAEDYSYNGKRYQRIPADEIIHEFLPEWVWQTRGFPWMTSSLLRMNMLSGYEEAELVASRVASSKMGFYETTGEDAFELLKDGKLDNQGNLVEEVEPGIMERLPPGVTFKAWDPQHPSTAYGDFVKSCLRGMSAGLGVSYNSLANDLEGVNYNSLRKGALDDNAVWMALQDWVVETLCDRVNQSWLSNSLLAGVLTVFGKSLNPEPEERYQSVVWQPRRWEWVDPLKAMSAHEKAFAHKVRSPQSVIREMGEDPEKVLDDWEKWEQMLRDRKLKTEPASAGSSVSEDEETDEDDKDVNEED